MHKCTKVADDGYIVQRCSSFLGIRRFYISISMNRHMLHGSFSCEIVFGLGSDPVFVPNFQELGKLIVSRDLYPQIRSVVPCPAERPYHPS